MNELVLQRGLLAIFGLQILINLPDQPFWVTAAAMAMTGWRYYRTYRAKKLPGIVIKGSIILASFFFVFQQYREIFSLEPASSLLILLTAGKSFEVRSKKDGMTLLFLCYFLLIPRLVESQTILVTLLMIADIFLVTAFMSYYQEGQHSSFGIAGRRTLLLALKAIPIVLLMFFVFPRFTVNLLPGFGQGSAQSGFSERLSPGDISQLALDGRRAFRVQFEDRIPPLDHLYWRGGVLNTSQGLSWFQTDKRIQPLKKKVRPEKDYSAVIYQEGDNTKWLFAIDWPVGILWQPIFKKYSVSNYAGNYYRARTAIKQPLVYQTFGVVESPKVKLTKQERKNYLQTPSPPSQRIKGLLQEVIPSDVDLTEEEIAKRLLEFFAKGGFHYTLNPGLINDLEEFLFEKRSGFCEHFAASMGTLLRYAGIPSRVIIGFHGGKPSLLNDYFIVSYQDAHAWIEYYDKQRWVRIDPTSVVAPERFQLGAFEYFSNQVSQGEGQPNNFSILGRELTHLWYNLSMAWDQAEMGWTRFLTDFDITAQQDFLRDLGLGTLSGQFVRILSVVTLLLLFIGLWLLSRQQRRRESESKALRRYRKFCARMGKQGFEKGWNEGPVTFAERLVAELPEQRHNIEREIGAYVKSEYSSPLPGVKN